MNVLIERKWKKDAYTIGRVYVNDVFLCNSIEDKDRGLEQYMSAGEIDRLKVYGETAIPRGNYKVTMTYSPKYKRVMPQIMNVPGFAGIRIHSGNTVSLRTFFKKVKIDSNKELLQEKEFISVI